MVGEIVMATEPPSLLDAMLAMIRRDGCEDAARVLGYRERSYNIGYCETCSEMVSEVRIYYRRENGTEDHYEVGYTRLGEVIRALTDDPDTARAWDEAATHEPDEERWDRGNVHSFDEEPRPW